MFLNKAVEMTHSLFGQVTGVRKFSNGDVEVDFHHDDEIIEYRHSPDPSRLSNFPKELVETLASTLATGICIEIYFDEEDNPTHIELEECGDDDDDLEQDTS
jgi:hypothetical protein